MEQIDIARELAPEGRLVEIGSAYNKLFRVWDGDETRLVKVYSGVPAEKRETRALEMLAGLPGLPQVQGRGSTADLPWVVFDEAGPWTLGSLPGNPELARRAGGILAALHAVEPGEFSNVQRGIDNDWVHADFGSTFRRLERYRGRLHVPAELVEEAAATPPPHCSEPVISHTNPTPETFLVDDGGNVTLMHWEWSTLAPPEWDYTRALWLLSMRWGEPAVAALAEAYGTDLTPQELGRWTVYHAGLLLVSIAETPDEPLSAARPFVEELEAGLALAG